MLAADRDRLARFEREAEVLASLNHLHIATVYGFDDGAGVKALVMELVDGPALADRIARARFPWTRHYKRTGIWAFGAVLYEMLTGRRAFEGKTSRTRSR